ncbi:MAG: serine hydrolase domain-containing protein, partial [Rhodothermales bacterium]
LSTTAGLALDRGRIADLHDPVHSYVPGGHFDGPRREQITWHHLLQQTSEWEGTLWGKPDTADRRRGKDRALHEPGTFWEYNDVRVNLTALALMHVWEKPLPDVLKEEIMDPIDASDTWQWHGYRNSDVEVNGRTMKSVSGGGHWGGGMWISARDLARFGYLFLRRGQWKERQLFPETWIDRITTPCEVQPTYGYMWWLNTEGQLSPDAPVDSYAALGGGTNLIWIFPRHDLVVVTRWIDRNAINTFLQKIVASIEGA